MISREMSKIETNVLNLIVNRATFEEPIKAEKVRQETGLSKRSLEEVIESLRVNFKHPIVAQEEYDPSEFVYIGCGQYRYIADEI